MGKILVKADVPDAMRAEVVADKVYESIRAKYNLRNAARVIDTNGKIHLSFPIIDGRVAGHRNVPELEEAEIGSQSYTQVDATLHKNVAHVLLSEEAQMSAMGDIMSWNAEDAGKELGRIENVEIAEVMADFNATAGADWTDNANDPFTDVMDAITDIRENNLNPDQIWMEPAVYAALVSNQNVVDRLERGRTAEGLLPSIAGLPIGIDNELTDESAFVLDSSAPAIFLADGPELIGEYKLDAAFADGYIVADFMHVEAILDDAGEQLTGLLS